MDERPTRTPARHGIDSMRRARVAKHFAALRLPPSLRGDYPGSFLIPALLLMGVFFLLPSLLSLVYAFTDWTTFRSEVRFTGLQNFQDLISDGTLQRVAWQTLLYAIIATATINLVALAVALALEQPTRSNLTLRALFFVPVLISPLAAGFVFRGILAPDGPLNDVLSVVGGGQVTVSWLGTQSVTIVVVAFVHAWKWFGIQMLIYVAGLNAVPRELIDAARVEGSGPLGVARHVKLPLMGPAVTANLVLSLIGALTTLDIILATTRGGPARSTELLNFLVFSQFGQGFFGYATAASLVVVILVCVVALPLAVALRRREVEL